LLKRVLEIAWCKNCFQPHASEQCDLCASISKARYVQTVAHWSAQPGTGARHLSSETSTDCRAPRSGAMGVLLLAQDESLDRLVANKFIPSALLDSKLRAQFITKARAMARANPANVLQIHAFGERDDAPSRD
jgi:hypothetical protein